MQFEDRNAGRCPDEVRQGGAVKSHDCSGATEQSDLVGKAKLRGAHDLETLFGQSSFKIGLVGHAAGSGIGPAEIQRWSGSVTRGLRSEGVAHDTHGIRVDETRVLGNG